MFEVIIPKSTQQENEAKASLSKKVGKEKIMEEVDVEMGKLLLMWWAMGQSVITRKLA